MSALPRNTFNDGWVDVQSVSPLSVGCREYRVPQDSGTEG